MLLGGVDYEELTDVSVDFNPGVFSQTVILTTMTDTSVEGDERLLVTISTTDSRIDISPSTANVTIVEDSM